MFKRMLRRWLELDLNLEDNWDTINLALSDSDNITTTRDNLKYRKGYRFNMYHTHDCNWIVEVTNDVDSGGTFQSSNFTKLYVISDEKNIGEELNKILFLEKLGATDERS